jgi:hypothetical protein
MWKKERGENKIENIRMIKVETRRRLKRKQEGQIEKRWEQGNKARKHERERGGQAGKKEMSGRN